MLFPASTFALLAACSSVLASPARFPYRANATTLNAAAATKGRYIGSALTIRDDAVEQGILKDKAEIGSITGENSMKWEATEPNRYQFTFDGGDQIANFAVANGQELRCHTLVWHSQLPSWVSNGGFDNATLIAVMENHINNLMARWKGKCTQWDVVNEALNEDGTYRSSVFYNTIGEAFLPIAFRLAAAADPEVKLFYNDYNLEYGSAKALGAQRIVKLIQSYGVKIDGVGLQGHLTAAKTPTSDGGSPSQEVLDSTLALYTDLGVDVAYTELDIRMATPPSQADIQAQDEAFARVATSCVKNERCLGITLWGISDKYSWIPDVFPGEGYGLLWDENLQKKSAYTAFLNAFLA